MPQWFRRFRFCRCRRPTSPPRPTPRPRTSIRTIRAIRLARASTASAAFIWYQPEGTQELAWRLFRSYDGKGSRFGDRWLDCGSDNADLSVFAARRDDGATTVVVVNKSLNSPCELRLDVGKLKGSVSVWRFDQETGDKVVEIAEQAGAVDGAIKRTMAAASASILVIAPEKSD